MLKGFTVYGCAFMRRNTASNANLGNDGGWCKGGVGALVRSCTEEAGLKLTLSFLRLTVISDEKKMKTFIDLLFIKHSR